MTVLRIRLQCSSQTARGGGQRLDVPAAPAIGAAYARVAHGTLVALRSVAGEPLLDEVGGVPVPLRLDGAPDDVLSRNAVPIAEWAAELAKGLVAQAEQNAQTATALRRLVAGT